MLKTTDAKRVLCEWSVLGNEKRGGEEKILTKQELADICPRLESIVGRIVIIGGAWHFLSGGTKTHDLDCRAIDLSSENSFIKENIEEKGLALQKNVEFAGERFIELIDKKTDTVIHILTPPGKEDGVFLSCQDVLNNSTNIVIEGVELRIANPRLEIMMDYSGFYGNMLSEVPPSFDHKHMERIGDILARYYPKHCFLEKEREFIDLALQRFDPEVREHRRRELQSAIERADIFNPE